MARGGTVAEFPTTLAAAQAARDRGLTVVMGAPNELRGRSHNANASGRDLIERGLITAIASDYLPSSLLAAVFSLVDTTRTDLASAVRLVTSGPAEVAGLSDRGRLEPGLRADLALIAAGGRWPVVHSVLESVHVAGGDR